MVWFARERRGWGRQLTSQTLPGDCELERQLTDERFLEADRPDMAPFRSFNLTYTYGRTWRKAAGSRCQI